MVSALQAGQIDVAVGLTEGWIAGLCKALSAQKNAGYQLVGTYVESPLRWAISTGSGRDDLKSVQDLKGKKVGVSRIGSGSYVMSYVLAQEQKWLKQGADAGQTPFPVEVLNTFANLRDGVNHKTADFFMWEYFTSKRYYDNGEIKHIGDVYSPWPSWMIVASNSLLYPDGRHQDAKPLTDELQDVLQKINLGIKHFEENQEEAVQYISTKLDYSEEDALEWLKTVVFASGPNGVNGVGHSVIREALQILGQAGVVDERAAYGEKIEELVAVARP